MNDDEVNKSEKSALFLSRGGRGALVLTLMKLSLVSSSAVEALLWTAS